MDDPDVRYVHTSDGVNIAYATSGEGTPLVYCAGYVSHLQVDLEEPGREELFDRLSASHELIRFDKRGMGLSDWEVEDLSQDARVRDLEAVVDAIGTDRVALWGVSEGGPTAIQFAATHPDRVSHLVLYGTFSYSGSHPPEGHDELVALLRTDWGLGSAAMAAAFGVITDPEYAAQFVRLQREATSGENAAKMWDINNTAIDVRPSLPEIRSPTLLVHRRDDPLVSFDNARFMATRIPGARLHPLPGNTHPASQGDVAGLANAVLDFIAPVAGSAKTPPGDFRTILFTDVENSTDLVVRHGDAKYRELLAEHERLVREALAEHEGNEIKTIGDSFMCWFSSASSALGAAQAMQRKITDHYGDGLRIRIGIHAGEPIQEADGDLYGTSVVRASRIMGQADGGQIFVSQVVMDLVEGKGYLFHDAGEFALKGYERAVHLFDVAWEAE